MNSPFHHTPYNVAQPLLHPNPWEEWGRVGLHPSMHSLTKTGMLAQFARTEATTVSE
jgi:hypothetical protein